MSRDDIDALSQHIAERLPAFYLDGYNVRQGADVDILEEAPEVDPEHQSSEPQLYTDWMTLEDSGKHQSCKTTKIPDRVRKEAMQCRGKTKKGLRCKNRTTRFGGCCHLHSNQLDGLQGSIAKFETLSV